MQPSPTVFSQLTSALYPAEFSRCVEAFPTLRPTRGLTEYDQFLALCFAQLTYRESLRDTVACLRSKESLQYHLGFRGRLSRTNLAYANRYRDWRVFQAVAQILRRRAARLYQDEPTEAALPKVIFALDSSIIALSLNLFPWGYYARSQQAALKWHLLLSVQGSLPAWAALTEADFADTKILDQVPAVCGASYVMDRAYLDFVRLFRLAQAGGYFVVRNKHQVRFRVLRSTPVDKATGLRCDQVIRLTSPWSVKSYPQPLRRIRFYEAEHQIQFTFLTNQFELPAGVITELYRQRWHVELFFKWIKQHLRLRHFYGRSENAVRSQIWSAISAYLLVAIAKKRLNLRKNLHEILQIVSVSIFDQVPLEQLLASPSSNSAPEIVAQDSQNLFQFND